MSASRRRTVIVVVAALVVAATLVLAASSGPSRLVRGGPPETGQVEPSDRQVEAPASESDTTTAGERSAGPEVTDLGAWIHDLLTFALLGAGLLVVAGLLRAAVVRLLRELPEDRLVLDLAPLPDVEVGREVLRRDRSRHRQALAEGDVRNGIVGCWLLLEEAAAESGVPAEPAETATEFVVRFLHALDVDPRPVAALAHLFHEARFSTHPMGSNARARAETALEAIHRDLDRSAAR